MIVILIIIRCSTLFSFFPVFTRKILGKLVVSNAFIRGLGYIL